MRKRIIFVALVIAAAAITAAITQDKNTGKLCIGAPDDSGGMIIHYLINQKGLKYAKVQSTFDIYPIKDCCTSTSQWAMSTDLLDLAVMCPDAARGLLEKDSRFEILGAFLVNSDIIVLKPGQSPQKIGVTQNRLYQEQIIKERLGPGSSAVPMLSVALPYALEKGAVDGVVVDVLKGLRLEGRKYTTRTDEGDRVTYVLVARKSFIASPGFQQFIKLFNEAAGELNRQDVLLEEIKSYKKMNITWEEVKKWSQLGIRFVSITPDTSE